MDGSGSFLRREANKNYVQVVFVFLVLPSSTLYVKMNTTFNERRVSLWHFVDFDSKL